MKKLIVIILLVPFCLFAQQSDFFDTLKAEFNKNLTDSARYVKLLSISDDYLYYNPDSAIFYAQESVRFAMKNKDKLPPWTEWNSSDVLGKALWSAGNFPDAQEYFFKQITQSEAINDTLGILRAYLNLGKLNTEEGNYKEAIHYLRKGLPFFHGQGDIFAYFFTDLFSWLAIAYVESDNLDSALYYTQTRLNYTIKNFGKQNAIYSGLLFGMIYSKMGQPSLAMEYFRSFLKGSLSEKTVIFCDLEISKHFERYHQTDSAIQYALKSFNLSQKYNFKIDKLKAVRQLGKLYKSTNNIDSAFKYQNIMIDTEEDMFSREKLSRMNMLVFNEQLRQKEMEMEKIHQAEVLSQRLQLSVLAMVIIVFIIAFLLLSRSFIVSQRFVRSLGIILLLITFEYIDQLLHPIIANLTNHTPVLMLIILVSVASLMVPLHYRLEKWTKYRLTEKNKQIRLNKAKKIILETEEIPQKKQRRRVFTK